METRTASEILRAMPKAELHLHLEGTTSPETLWELSRRNGVALPAQSLDELRALYVFEDFGKFVRLWLAMCACLKTDADYVHMVEGYAEDCRRQNIRYVEAHFTPYNHERFGIGGRPALEVVTDALLRAEGNGGPTTRLILDIPSEAGAEASEFTARLLEEAANPLVVAIGLGGPEEGWPRRDFREAFARARAAGYDAVAHAGETAGAHHVREAVEELKVRRVQHGVRAVEDDAVVALLAERGICCDVALTSNTFLTVYRDLAAHPLPKLLAAGVPVTLSTDDPPFFNTDLVREYERAHAELGLTLEQLWQIDLNGLRHALVDAPRRRQLLQEFETEGRALGLGAR